MTFHNTVKVLQIHNLHRSNQSHIIFVYLLIFIIYFILLYINTSTLFIAFVCTYNAIYRIYLFNNFFIFYRHYSRLLSLCLTFELLLKRPIFMY